jgi:hypothetical protein
MRLNIILLLMKCQAVLKYCYPQYFPYLESNQRIVLAWSPNNPVLAWSPNNPVLAWSPDHTRQLTIWSQKP